MSERDRIRLSRMAEQDRHWKEKRMVSGHGAQDGSARDKDYKALIVVIAGPIKHWWDENWMSEAHLEYDQWRTDVEEACVDAGFLVYKPYTAFKGTWNEQAQVINNSVVTVADLLLVLTPPGVPSEGTDEEIKFAEQIGTPVLYAPPGKIEDLEGYMHYMNRRADVKNGR